MPEQLSQKQFRHILSEQLHELAAAEGLQLDNAEQAGYAFSLWLAQLLMHWNVALEEDVYEVTNRGGGDLGIDLALRDEGNRTIYIVQAKFRGLGAKANSIDIDAARAFLSRHDDLLDPHRVARGNEHARELLSDYGELLRHGWRARSLYITTARDTASISDEYDLKNDDLAEGPYEVEFSLFDTSRLRELYTEVQAREVSIPEHVEIDIPSHLFFVNDDAPYPYLVGMLKGNSIRNEYRKKGRRDSLFAWNIRNYLGDRGINRKIKHTATHDPDSFCYFNNGITAVCKKYSVDGNRLSIEKFQIINGAQTVASIARAPENEHVMVLFRLIETGRVDTEGGINRQIIETNNTQNAIRDSDFRSNDPIQKWLEQSLNGMRATDLLGAKITYQRKRTGRRGQGRTIKLEEFAKIRYAFLCEPCVLYDSPKLLWTPRSEPNGLYEQAFGIDGEIADEWSKSDLEEAILAIAVHDFAASTARQERKKNESLGFLYRLRFHAVALVGEYLRVAPDRPSNHSLLGSRETFEKEWRELWRLCRSILYNLHRQHVRREDDPMTLSAFMRSEKVWDQMKDQLMFETSAVDDTCD